MTDYYHKKPAETQTKLTIRLLHRHHVGGGTTLNDGVTQQVATLGHHSHQLKHTCTTTSSVYMTSTSISHLGHQTILHVKTIFI